MSNNTSTIANTRKKVWQDRIGSALRTTLACTIVACTSLYGPQPLRRYLNFPAFSYVTTILVVSDANLGDTIRGCCHVLCAILQAMAISMFSLRVIGPANFSNEVAALAVAAGSFVVALPESSDLLTKRVAFGQLVIVYVSTVTQGEGVTMYPIHAACSAALGALASLFAIFLPYPRFAHHQARKFYRLYAENSSERLNCNIEAISTSENSAAVDFLNQAKSLSTAGAKLLKGIRCNLDGMHWERPHTRIFNPHCIDLEEKIQDMLIPIRGMDIALSRCTSFPVDVIDEELRGVLLNCRGRFSKKLDQQDKCFTPFDASTTSESKKEILNKNLSIACKDLPTSFFLYCVQVLLDNSPVATKTDNMVKKAQKSGDSQWTTKKIREVVMNFMPSNHSLVYAFKCSLSLGLAVLFGLIYTKENGYMSGLTLAICFETGPQPIFSIANARGQGTAMGAVYGVLCCFIFHRFGDLTFFLLLPWVAFYSFLRHSRMYGQSGAISAVLGALLVLGTKHYGPPSQFAIARTIEGVIGLLCLVIVEALVCPSRAATLAKSELPKSLRALQDCIGRIAITISREKDMPTSGSQALREGQKKLKYLVCQLEESIAAAELEPNFWFLPFHSACYHKLLESLSRMVDLLLFVAYSMENIARLSQKDGGILADLQDRVNENILIFKNKVGPTLKCLEEITRMKSLTELEKELKNRNLPCDIESGQHPNAETLRTLNGNEVDSITSTFLQHLEEMASKSHTNKDEEAIKGQMLLHYSCLGFCTTSLVGETIKVESEVKELLMWENPSSQANMKEIYSKISALHSR